MGEATSPAPILTYPVEATACVADHLLSRETSLSPSREGTGSGVSDASALHAGSSTTLILVEDKERDADSMPPPPDRKEIVLALHAPSVVPATSPAPIPTSPVEAPACVADHLSFRERLVRRQAEKEQVRAGAEFPSSSALAIAPGHGAEVVTPRDAGTLAGSGIRDASALPAG
ncbi:hypothetical protein F2Q68_00022025 [Brassica cretica]|uniref:Uncharacterized protein n=1 Tax=Brassica cretica TaxID=69181 RepID=A0A8S9G2Y7_BRACR|nr:hypothetical protein F2Q68_00022025 [Brassica cretica]